MSFFRLSAVVSAFAAVLLPLPEIGFAQSLSGASLTVEADWSSGYMGLGSGLAWVIALRDTEKPVAENSVAESTVAETPATETPRIETSSVEKSPVETSSVETPGAAAAPVSESAATENTAAESAATDSPVTEKPAAAPRPPRRARSARNARRMIDNWTPIAFVAQTLDHTGMNIASLGMHAGLR